MANSPQLSTWLQNSPAANPNLWIALNGVCCVGSFLLGLVFWCSIPVALPIYACYNFGTTVVWCFEAAMSLSYTCAVPHHKGQTRTNRIVEGMGHGLLLSMALYFLVDSVDLFRDIVASPEQVDEYQLDVLVSFVCYFFAIVYVYWEQRNERTTAPALLLLGNDGQMSNHDDVEHQYGSLS